MHHSSCDEQAGDIKRAEVEDIESALRQAAELCKPPVRATLEPTEASAGPALVIRVPRSDELHSLDDGRVLVRSGGENRPLRGDEIRNMANNKATGDFEVTEVAGASLDDLDTAMIDEYIVKREERMRRRYTGDRVQLLHEIGVIGHHDQPLVAGILLFGKNPQAYMPQSGLVFVKFPGVEPRAEGGVLGYGRREEINGPLARVVERAWQVILEEMRVGAVVTGLARQDVLEYPEYAVREALVNAVAHRDYHLRGRRIEIRKFADRMEIVSPGGLAGYMTLENLVEEHFSRNPRLVQGLFQWGYIEELGLGIDRMIEDMVASGHPPPKFSPTSYSFSVVLSNHRERHSHAGAVQPIQTPAAVVGAAGGGQNINERQARALIYIREHGRITNRDYQTLCPEVSAETLRTDLVDLVERGMLLRIGEKKGTYYITK